jgi:hypothetical protein
MYCLKKTCKYILLSTFEQKLTFLAISKPKSAGNHPFFVIIAHSGRLGGKFDFFDSLHHHPLPRHFPLPIVGAPSIF